MELIYAPGQIARRVTRAHCAALCLLCALAATVTADPVAGPAAGPAGPPVEGRIFPAWLAALRGSLSIEAESFESDSLILQDVHLPFAFHEDELWSNLVFREMNQAAAWLISVTSIPSLNLIPITTFAR